MASGSDADSASKDALTRSRIASEAQLIAAQIRALEERTAILRAWVQAHIGEQRRRTDAAIESQKSRDRLSRDELYWTVIITLALIAQLYSLA